MEGMKTFELKVGIFVLIGAVILFLIVFSVGDINLIKSGYHINVIFSFAAGIGPSAPVRLAGVGIGEVEGIHLFYDEKEKRTKAVLSAWIQQDTRIEEDATATVNTLGLLGEKYLELCHLTARGCITRATLHGDGEIGARVLWVRKCRVVVGISGRHRGRDTDVASLLLHSRKLRDERLYLRLQILDGLRRNNKWRHE